MHQYFFLFRSGTPTKDVEKSDKAEKRKAMVGFLSITNKKAKILFLTQVANLLDPNAEAPAKKSRLEQFGAAAPAAMQGNEAISEEAVRRCLVVILYKSFAYDVFLKVPEEKAHDHNRLAQEVPVQEDWNPKCPTGPHFDQYYGN